MARVKINSLNYNREGMARNRFTRTPYYLVYKDKVKNVENKKFEEMLANSCAKYLGE